MLFLIKIAVAAAIILGYEYCSIRRKKQRNFPPFIQNAPIVLGSWVQIPPKKAGVCAGENNKF